MKICLYAAIASHGENIRHARSAWRELKCFIKRSRDRVLWQFSPNKTFDHDAWCHLIGTNRGDMAIRLAIQDLFARGLGTHLEYLEYTWGNLDQPAIDEINATCDLFVIAGGGYLFTGENGSLGNGRLTADLSFLQRITCPKIAYSIGLNQVLDEGFVPPKHFNSAAAETVCAWTETLDLISVRDAATRDLLAQVTNRPIFLIGDPALFLESARSPQPLQNHVGINFAVHGPRAVSILRKHFRTYVELLRKLERRGFVLRYFQHSDADIVLLKMFESAGLRLRIVDADPRGLAQAYSEVQFVFSQMLHSAILAASVDVPSISTAYDRKNFAFYELMGLENYCVHHDHFSEQWALERVDSIVQNRDMISRSIAEKKAALLQAHSALHERIKKLIMDRTSCNLAL